MNPQNPYGVPTAFVPRVSVSGYQRTEPALPADPIQQAVDNWLLMERKAQAWDDLGRLAAASSDPVAPLVVDLMARLVKGRHNVG